MSRMVHPIGPLEYKNVKVPEDIHDSVASGRFRCGYRDLGSTCSSQAIFVVAQAQAQ